MFGHLYDGLNCMYRYTSSTLKPPLTELDDPLTHSLEHLDEYRRTWQLRRDLAELSRRPEGYLFTYRASDGRFYSVPLLSPPDMEAVQRADGTWYRARRQQDITNHRESFTPIPYTEQWYQDYLHNLGLPDYFLRVGHLAMIHDNLETKRLGMMNAPSPQYATIPRRDYLNLRFSATPHWPRQGSNGTYRLEIQTEGARASLAHYFPALSVTEFQYRVYVLPSGYIQLRSMTEIEPANMPVQTEDDVDWDGFEEGQMVLSSYHREIMGNHFFHRQSQPRDALIQSFIDQHAVINPTEDIPGQGRMAFLTDEDEERAYSSGYINDQNAADPQLVNQARMRGELAVGTGPNAGPIVVFRPNQNFRNPRLQPQGSGAWHFLTSDGPTSNRGFAAINLGGSHGLPTYPTASQIRRLGQLFIEDGREDLTDMIDIVWVPGAEDNDPGEDPVLDGTIEAADEEASPTRTKEQEASRNVEPASDVSSPPSDDGAEGEANGLHPNHDPTDGRPGTMHDQTGDPIRAVYETQWSGGRYITVDRSRVWLGKVEPHKFYSYSARGWVQWKHWKDMDWNDPDWINALNKHREQTYQRAKIWNRKRDTKREDYAQEENEYVWGIVAEAQGNRPSMSIRDITREFNARFGSRIRRNETGIGSLVDRLRKMFKKHGYLLPKKDRGWKQQEVSKALRGEAPNAEQDGEEGEEDAEQSGEEGEEDEGGDEDDADGDFEDDNEDAAAESDD